jgi:two-component system OmpR family sensor kinase
MCESTRLLYVADQGEPGDGVATALEREHESFTVEVATNTSDALSRLPDGFDCVVADGLSEGESIRLLEDIREEDPQLPVVLSPDTDRVDPPVAAGAPDEVSEQALLADRVQTAIEDDGERVRLRSGTFPDVAFYVDETGRYVDIVAPEGAPLPEESPDTLQGKQLRDVLPAAAAEDLHESVGRALDTGEVQTVQYRFDPGDGERWFEARVSPAERTGVDREHVLMIARDITDRKERETALKALHGMATTIQTADTVEEACELTVTAAADILDFELCSAVIQEGDLLVPYAMSERARPDTARTMRVEEGLAGKSFRNGESYVVDKIRSNDVTQPSLEVIESGLSAPIGEHGVFQAVSVEPGAFDETDITLAELLVSHTRTAIDRIEREEALTRKTERLEEFASFVSHDLRNPLNVATLRTQLLSEECDSEHLDGLEGALDRMERLIDELLTLARQGDTIGDTEPVSLDSVVHRAWSNVGTEDATLDCRTDPTLYADRNRLTAVLENLVRNAIEHGSDNESGVSVTVRVGDTADGTGFYVADDGTGIPESEREQVFQSGYSTVDDGTGFGLTIVRDIVEAHDWEIEVTDSAEGGTRFDITGVEFAG